jgi:hypothetical protein
MSKSSASRPPCPHCRSPNAPGARYCRECGRDLDPDRFAAPEWGDRTPADEEPGWRPTPTMVIAAAVVLLLLLVTGGILLLTGGDDAPPRRAATPPPPAQDPPPPPPDNSPTGVIRRHWRAIAAHDYDDAYDLLSSDYRGRVSRAEWVGSHKRAAPRVHIRLVRKLPGGQRYVFADIVTRDTGSGGDSSVCRRFVGKVRVIQQGGNWRYRPNAPGDTFTRRTLPRSNRSCGRLFS